MEVNCRGCAGCCLDWRPLAEVPPDHERRGRYRPLDNTYNLVPLSGDEVRAFLEAGYGDVLVPRVFTAEAGVTVDGYTLASVGGGPAFYVGLRKVPKPVAPFGTDPTWLDSCTFLDPETLQCRLHGDDHYPETCATYPGDNLALEVTTECERVETAFGGDRLGDETPPDGAGPGPTPLGSTVFVHPNPDRLTGAVERLASGTATTDDRAEFVAVAAGHRPGSLEVDRAHYEEAYAAVQEADSWAGRAIAAWERRATADAPDPADARAVEEDRGAPPTPGWD